MIAKRWMVKGLVLLVALVCWGAATPAAAQYIGPYLQIQAGGFVPDTVDVDDRQGRFSLEFEPAEQLGVALGVALDPDWGLGEGRLELAYGYQATPAETAEFADSKVPATGDLVLQTVLLNAWGHLQLDSAWSTYVGAGIGAGWVEADGLQISGQPLSDDDALGLAYQFGLGLDYAVTGRCWLDLGYRFQGLSEIELVEASGERLTATLHGHSLILGLRVGF